MLEKEIIKKLSDYLEGKIDINQFNEWFIPITWNLEEGNKAYKVALDIKFAFAEYTTNGNWTGKWKEEKIIFNEKLKKIFDNNTGRFGTLASPTILKIVKR